MGVTTMQVTLRQWPGMKLSWLGAGAVLHSGDDPTPSAAQLVVSPHGSTECAVVIGSHNVKLLPEMVEELGEVLAHGLPRGFSTMRFVAWDGACALGDRPAAAHMLSMRLGIDVISAAGPLLGVPGGSLFAPVGRGAQRPGGWWRFRAGTMPVRVGWRFPAPHWEADLGEIPELPGDLVLEHIPAGLWLHRRSVGSVTDLAFSVPTDHAHPSLILSHPSEEPLCREELGHGIGALPALAADKVVFTPYGQQPLSDGPVGPVVADLLGRAVHVRTGLPLCAAGGQEAVVTIDDKCLPRWRTFARELWHAPHGTPRAVDWTNPAPEVLTMPAGQAAFALGSGWVCEVIEAGIWIRPENIGDQADWIRAVPVDVNRCAIVVGAPHTPETDPPTHMITGLLERMPVDARKRAYLAVPRGAAPNVFVLATDMRDALPDPGDVELLSPATQNPSSPGAPSAHASLRVAPPGTFSAGSSSFSSGGSSFSAGGSSFDVLSRPSRRDDPSRHPAVARKPSPDFEQVNPQVPGLHPRRGEAARAAGRLPGDPSPADISPRRGDLSSADLLGRHGDLSTGDLPVRRGADLSSADVLGRHGDLGTGDLPPRRGPELGRRNDPARGGDFGATDLAGRRFDGPLDAGRTGAHHSGEQPRVDARHHSGEQPRVNGAHHAPEPRAHRSGEEPRLEPRTGDIRTGDVRGGDIRTGDVRGELATGGFRPVGLRTGDIRGGDARGGEFRTGEFRTGDIRGGDVRGEFRTGDIRGGDLRTGDIRGGELPAGAIRPGEPATGGGRPVDPRTGDIRGGEPATGALRPIDPRTNGELPTGAMRMGEMPTGDLHRTGEFRRGAPERQIPGPPQPGMGAPHNGAPHNGALHNGAPHNGAGHNGHGTNGHAVNGHGTNGQAVNGHGADGLGANGHSAGGPVRGGMTYGSGPVQRPDQRVPEQTGFIEAQQPVAPHVEDAQYRSQAMPVYEERPVTDSGDDVMTTTGAQQRMSGKEVRSHRTGGKAPKRDDDKTNTQELDRLLGFFDAIRQAKAWDEDPTADDDSDRRAVKTGRRH